MLVSDLQFDLGGNASAELSHRLAHAIVCDLLCPDRIHEVEDHQVENRFQNKLRPLIRLNPLSTYHYI